MPIRILIADDHAVFRRGLKALLEKESDLEVVGETENGFDTIQAVTKKDADVLILEITIPGLSGAKVAETALKKKPHLAIVILTMHEDECYLQELFRIGIRGYVLKKSTDTSVMQAIRAAMKGEHYIDSSLTGHLISSYIGHQTGDKITRGLDLLTAREKEVLKHLAYGHTNAEIAEKLCISLRTVEKHRKNFIKKLDFKSRAQIVRFAIDNAILTLA